MLEDYEREKNNYIFNSRIESVYYGYTNNMAIRRALFDELGRFVELPRGSDVMRRPLFLRQRTLLPRGPRSASRDRQRAPVLSETLCLWKKYPDLRRYRQGETDDRAGEMARLSKHGKKAGVFVREVHGSDVRTLDRLALLDDWRHQRDFVLQTKGRLRKKTGPRIRKFVQEFF